MADPFTTFTDATLGVIELLRAQLPAHGYAGGNPVTIGATTTGARPHVMVRRDGSDGRYPGQERVTTRITCWDDTEAQAVQLAQVCRAILLSTDGTDKIRSTSPLTGPVPTADPDTAEHLATLTLYVQTRPLVA